MNGNDSTTIECICRKYRVQTKGGMIVEVESTKPLSKQMTNDLLQEDDDINTFFSNHRIMNIRHMVITSANKRHQERDIESKPSPKNGRFTPRQRFNHILKMKGEFTRNDYQKHMLDMYGVKIEKFMAYDDIRDAIVAKRLEIVEGTIGRIRKYRVLDPTDVDETLYKTMMKDRKIQMGILH